MAVLGCLAVACLLALACHTDPSVRKQQSLEKGNKYFAEGKYSYAIIEYRNAVDIDPSFGEARKRLAEAYARSGDAQHAFEQYVRAADLLPGDAELQLTAGTYLLAARRPKDALARADNALKQKPDDIQGHLLRGNALAGLSSFDDALKAIEEAIRLDPERGTSFTQLGLVEFARGRRDEAEAAFTRAVELAPKSVETYLALGNFYWSLGKARETEKAFRGALEVDPKNSIANRAMAAFSIATGKYRDAEPYLLRLAESGEPAAVFSLTDYYMAAGRAKDAVARLEATKAANNGLDVEQRLARAYAAAGDTARAKTLVAQVLADNPGAVDAQLLNGQLLLNDGHRDEAFDAIRAAVTSNPDSAEAQFALARLYTSRGDAAAAEAAYREVLRINPRAAAAQVAIARLQLSSGNRDAAVRTVEEVTRTEPTNLDARLQLVRSLIASKDLQRAERELNDLRTANPNVGAIHVQTGLLALLKNDTTGARASFERAESLDPKSIDLLAGWMALDFKTNNAAGAKARIEQRLKEGTTPALLILAAQAYFTANDPIAGERALRQAIELDPSLLPPYEMLGRLYMAQKKLPEARKEFEALAKRQVKPVSALTMVGMILMTEGQTELAKKKFEEVLGLDSNAVIANNNLAWIHAETGNNLDVALGLAKSATAQAPDQPEIMDTLGWVYYKKNQPELAIPLFENCVKRAPANASYHHHLGLAYLKAGRSAEARASFRRALANNPDATTANDANRALAQIGPA
ncbi:MAG TPA: tetratricopeptide repeat protein [Gemmatimonadaceae bacterium]|nr:tetratricopeptide repeat protein [Gemmatimonadaceae bacterium]